MAKLSHLFATPGAGTITRIIFLIVMLSCRGSYAQLQLQNLIRHYDIQEGLSNSVVNDIVQDRQSLMWFATEDGLNRFDGYSFKVFKYDPQIKGSIPANFIQHIHEDQDGDLWISSRRGLIKFDPVTELFTLYHDQLRESTTYAPNVNNILSSRDGNLWLGIYGNGIAHFNKHTGKATLYKQSNLPELNSDKTTGLLADNYGRLWVSCQGRGLNVFNVDKNRIISEDKYLSNTPMLKSVNIWSFVQDKAGNIWMGTSNGLMVYLRAQNKYYVFNDPRFAIAGKSISVVFADSKEILWIAIDGEGLYQMSLKEFQATRPTESVFEAIRTLDNYDISRSTVNTLYEDRDKNIWAGMLEGGVYLISDEHRKFSKIQKTLFYESSVSLVSYHGICNDRDGSLWLGTNGQGIYKTDLRGTVKKRYIPDGRKGSLGDNWIICALRDSRDRLWFGSFTHGLYGYDRTSDSFRQFTYNSKGPLNLNGFEVRSLFEDSKKNIWVGTNRGGLCLLDVASGHYSVPDQFTGVLRDGDVRAIAEAPDGTLWIGFYGDGLYQYEPSTNKLTHYLGVGGKWGPLSNHIVSSLKFDRAARLWIGSSGDGLYRYDTRKDSLRNFSVKEGLANNTISSVQLDNKGNCWVSTNAGISRMDTQTEVFTNYTAVDGLQESKFNMGAGFAAPEEGYICFGGALGTNIFYPASIQDETSPPRTMISGLQIFNKPLSIQDSVNGKPVLKAVINQTREVTLRHDQSVITVDFFALNYNYPQSVRYAYILEGLDDEWNFVGQQRSATYRYLSPGHYTFKVKGSNGGDDWTGEPASLDITIRPPAWKTPIAYILYALLIAGLGFAVFTVGKRQYILRERLKAEQTQRKFEGEMAEEKLTFFTEISHEFRTPLTLIVGPLEEMLAKEDESTPGGRKLKMVYRNANKLLMLINKLLDYRKLESGHVFMKMAEDDIVSFTEEICAMFRELAGKRNINFRFTAEQPSIKAVFDKEKLEMVVTNILSNAFKYIGQGNEVSVSVAEEAGSDKFPAGSVVLKIQDNGMGIPKKQINHVFEWFYKGHSDKAMSSGIGLSLARKLVSLHNGTISVDSTEGQGSVFRIQIPLGMELMEPTRTPADVIPGIKNSRDLVVFSPESEDNATGQGGANTLLIVDDNDEIRGFLREYFMNTYTILESVNGVHGLEQALKSQPDLIISDVMMPEMDGVEFCRHIKSNVQTSHIPVILLTAKTTHSNQKEGMSMGADVYMSKPFSPEMLSLTVQNLLRSRDNLIRFYKNLFIDRSVSGLTISGESPDEKFLQTVYDYLKNNLDKPDFKVTDLCDVVNMSRSLFYRKIKALTGMSPVEYVRFLRMQEAAKLLKSRSYRVFEVAYMVGFSDSKYFRQVFTKEFGVSPSDYFKQTG